MSEYNVNRGVDKTIECFGLRSQYVLIVAVSLLLLFVLVSILFGFGAPPFATIAFAIIVGTGIVYGAFKMNKRYGRYGLIKCVAQGYLPRYVISRRKLLRKRKDIKR